MYLVVDRAASQPLGSLGGEGFTALGRYQALGFVQGLARFRRDFMASWFLGFGFRDSLGF